MQHDAVPAGAGRPLVDPALLLEALARLRAATGEPDRVSPTAARP